MIAYAIRIYPHRYVFFKTLAEAKKWRKIHQRYARIEEMDVGNIVSWEAEKP
jgi:hypothetical protein